MAASIRNPVVVILGATGTGKTKLSLELARRFNGEIISADAMQVYKGLDIITNKATSEERRICPHHMIDYLSPMKDNSTVVDFRNSALPIIDGLLGEHKVPIVVGGTNYYIESLLWKHLISDEDVEKARSGDASVAKIPRLQETLIQSDDGGNSKTDCTNCDGVSGVRNDDGSEDVAQQDRSDISKEMKGSGVASDSDSNDNDGEPKRRSPSGGVMMRGAREPGSLSPGDRVEMRGDREPGSLSPGGGVEMCGAREPGSLSPGGGVEMCGAREPGSLSPGGGVVMRGDREPGSLSPGDGVVMRGDREPGSLSPGDGVVMRGDREKYESLHNHELHRRLMEVDSVTAKKMHPNNRRKIIRALEVYDRTGVCLSDVYRAQHHQSALRGPLRYTSTCVFWLQCDRDVLDKRLDDRVDKMLTEGLVEELTTFHDQYNQQRLQDSRTADYTRGIFQSIGFKEFHDYLVLSAEEKGSERGKQLLEKGVEDLKTATRKYARYQKKWVQNRLLRRSNPADEIPPLYGLDCTDVSHWDDTVASPAVTILEATMKGDTSPVPCLPLLEDPVTEYEYNECKVCYMVLLTKHEWKAHQGTRKHRKLMKRYKRELGTLTQTLDTHVHNKSRESESDEGSPS